jgi:beta-phosphoglucomutase-like phosphatase (HAD superfamily)
MALPAAILDVDGTLVDTNYHHTLAWYRAFLAHDIVLALWRIHRHIGMGGDQLIASLCGEETDRERGDSIRAVENDRYMELIDEVRPFTAARRLIDTLRERGYSVVLASSAKSHEVDHYLDLLDARDAVDGWTRPRTSREPSRIRTSSPPPSRRPAGETRSWWGIRPGTARRRNEPASRPSPS